MRSGDEDSDWLKQAVGSFPEGTPYLVAAGGDYAEAVNEAVQAAGTKWIIVFSDDNVAAPFMLEHLLSHGFAADVVYPGIMDVDPDLERQLGGDPVPPFCGHRLLYDNYVPSASMVLRESFLAIGGYRSEAAPLEAWDMYVRGQRAGWRFKPTQTTFYYKRNRLEGRTATLDKAKLREVVVGDEPDMLATFYYQATHACAYLRCILPARYLPGVADGNMYSHVRLKDGVEAPQGEDDIEAIEFPYHHGKTAVMQFAGDSTWAILQHHLQENGIRTLVEVDDNYLTDPGKEVRTKSNWGQKIGSAMHTYQGHRYITGWADGVIVTTEQLASAYRRVNENVFVIPNPVDPWDWRHLKRKDDGIFRIGWLASHSHTKDIPLVTRAMEWASRQKDVEVVCLGITPGWKFKHTQLPWVDDLDAYRMMMGMVDVGVCPVVPDQFSLFRSDVKASELAMGGAAVVCSDVPPYADWTHEQSCLKARSAKDFYHHIKRLVSDREETRALADEGRKWVDANRNIHRLMPLWEEALQVKAPLAVAA